MARLGSIKTLHFSFIIIAIAMAEIHANEGSDQKWHQRLCQGKNKAARIHFYVQDALVNNPNATVYEVARSRITSTSPTAFGQIRVFDNLLTAKPGRGSRQLGRAQGFVVSADLKDSAFAVSINFVFTAGEYNGSTLSILGRNQILNEHREMPVVGGTGAFGLARGRAISRTYSYDATADYGVLEYTLDVVYV